MNIELPDGTYFTQKQGVLLQKVTLKNAIRKKRITGKP
jgi:hypothetical protein